MDPTGIIMAANEKSPISTGFCNQDCQNLLIQGAIYMSAAVGFLSLGLVANLIRRNLKSYIVPEIQEKIMGNLLTHPAITLIYSLPYVPSRAYYHQLPQHLSWSSYYIFVMHAIILSVRKMTHQPSSKLYADCSKCGLTTLSGK